jgi:hypothetical protein
MLGAMLECQFGNRFVAPLRPQSSPMAGIECNEV